jgi:hypothetical protein
MLCSYQGGRGITECFCCYPTLQFDKIYVCIVHFSKTAVYIPLYARSSVTDYNQAHTYIAFAFTQNDSYINALSFGTPYEKHPTYMWLDSDKTYTQFLLTAICCFCVTPALCLRKYKHVFFLKNIPLTQHTFGHPFRVNCI